MKRVIGIAFIAWAIEDLFHLMGLTQHTLWSALFYGVAGLGLLAKAWDEEQGRV